MKKQSLLTTLIYWLLRALQLQLFLTLFSLPFLCAWGIPLSLLSPLGNILFGPVLTLFLLISSLIFFTELIGIPNTLLITCLEYITSAWLYCMHADTKRWLIGFVQPSFVILVLLPLTALFIMLCKQTQSLYRSIIFLSLLLSAFWAYTAYLQQQQPHHIPITCAKGTVHLMQQEGKVVLIDPGSLGRNGHGASWIQYSLAPFIIQNTGRTTLDHLIILQPTARTCKAIESLMTKISVNNLYIPYAQGSLSPTGIDAYDELKKQCAHSATQLIPIENHIQEIIITPTWKLTITPLPFIIRTNAITYPAFSLHTFIDNQSVTLYSAKYSQTNLKL